MKKFKSKILSTLAVAVLFVASLFCLTACNNDDPGTTPQPQNIIEVSTSEQFKTAVETTKDNYTIKLKEDITVTENIIVKNSLTFDFDGKTLTQNNGYLFISADENETGNKVVLKNGTYLNTNDGFCVVVLKGNTLDLEQTFTINFGGLSENYSAIYAGEDSTINIYGKINVMADNSKSYALTTYTTSGKATVNVYNTAEITTNDNGLVIANNSVLNVHGKITSTNGFAISGQGNEDALGAYINIFDGANVTSINEIAIYMPSAGELNIKGGIITGKTAVYIKSGTTEITGGTFNATGDATNFEHNENGANATGAALVVEACGYPGGKPTVTIRRGTYNSANKPTTPIEKYNYNGNTADVENHLTDGTEVTEYTVPATSAE